MYPQLMHLCHIRFRTVCNTNVPAQSFLNCAQSSSRNSRVANSRARLGRISQLPVIPKHPYFAQFGSRYSVYGMGTANLHKQRISWLHEVPAPHKVNGRFRIQNHREFQEDSQNSEPRVYSNDMRRRYTSEKFVVIPALLKLAQFGERETLAWGTYLFRLQEQKIHFCRFIYGRD